MARQATEIKVYWDNQDRSNEGWAYRLSDADGDIDSGSLDSDRDDIDGAIDEAVSIAGVEVNADAFAREPNVDGGFAIWTAE